MNLKDWEKLSPVEQQRRLDERPIEFGKPMTKAQEERGYQAIAAGLLEDEAKRLQEAGYKPREFGNLSRGKCPAGLIELRNSLKREIEEESNAASQYREASVKLLHYEQPVQAKALKDMATEEMMHHYMLKFVVDYITKECGE